MTRFFPLLALLFGTPFVVAACSDISDDCEETGTCPEGTGGNNGEAGSDGSGSTSDGGNSSGGSSSACAEDCTGETPLCDEDSGECVACLSDADCTAGAPVCEAGACGACTSSDDCSEHGDAPTCETDSGACVECTADDSSACGVDDADTGKPFVCDVLNNTCSDTEVEEGASLCQSCLSNAHCRDNERCVEQPFDGTSVGYFCFEDPTAGGGAVSCDRPYVDVLTDAETIDGTTATICGLRTTTCPALSDFSETECAPQGTDPSDIGDEHHAACGADGLDDGYCALYQDFSGTTNDTYRCTVPCLSSDDCDTGSTCETGTPKTCSL